MDRYELKNLSDIGKRNIKIAAIIDRALRDIAYRFQSTKGRRFSKVMKKRLQEMLEEIELNIQQGVRNHWLLANEKTNKVLDGYLSSVFVSDAIYKSFRSPNLPALQAFLNRVDNGLGLSDRVWNLTRNMQGEIEKLLATGIMEGKPAITMAAELRRYVRGNPVQYNGKLIKGSNINYQAIRLASTEINMAFRTADYMQNMKLPFVTGVTVQLSASHPRTDICDYLQGTYPKDFLFQGWHPLCICYATYDTIPVDAFASFLKTGKLNETAFTKSIPDTAFSYLMRNREKILSLKNRPIWFSNNFTDGLELKTPQL